MKISATMTGKLLTIELREKEGGPYFIIYNDQDNFCKCHFPRKLEDKVINLMTKTVKVKITTLVQNGSVESIDEYLEDKLEEKIYEQKQ